MFYSLYKMHFMGLLQQIISLNDLLGVAFGPMLLSMSGSTFNFEVQLTKQLENCVLYGLHLMFLFLLCQFANAMISCAQGGIKFKSNWNCFNN